MLSHWNSNYTEQHAVCGRWYVRHVVLSPLVTIRLESLLPTTFIHSPIILKMFAGCIKWFRQSLDVCASTYLPFTDSQSCIQTMKWKLFLLEEAYFGPVERGPVDCSAWPFATKTARMISNRWKVKHFARPWEIRYHVVRTLTGIQINSKHW